MFAAFLLGLTGSIGHCVGMCSGIALLLGRTDAAQGWRPLLLHLGRITTYSLLGLAAGAVGYAMTALTGGPGHDSRPGHSALLPSGLSLSQGLLALAAAVAAVYMAVALLGRAPSPELLLSRITRRWGRIMRGVTASGGPLQSSDQSGRRPATLRSLATAYALGLLWGLLPCGLVLAALLAAAVARTPADSALTMLLFGLGTWPLGLGLSLAPRWPGWRWRAKAWLRPAAAAVVLLFGVQMAFRGLAAWGWIDHAHVGGLALW